MTGMLNGVDRYSGVLRWQICGSPESVAAKIVVSAVNCLS
jgi:hypothetical protein